MAFKVPTVTERLLYSRMEAAHLLSISLRSLTYLITQGRIKTRKIGGRNLVAAEELVRFVKSDQLRPMVAPK